MKKPRLMYFLSGTLLAAFLFGCTSEKETPQASNAQGASIEDEDDLPEKDVEEKPVSQPEPQRENMSSPTPSELDVEKIRKELLMNDKWIKLPSHFPGQQNRQIQGSVASNNSATYSIQYHTSTGEPLAHVTAARYRDLQEASSEIEDFQEGKTVDPSAPRVEPFENGLSGHMKDSADQYRYSGQQNQWLVSLSSSSSRNLDQTAVIRQMTEYLKHHPLPASADQGVVDIYYAPSSEDVTVDIRWQEGKTVYAVRTSLPPIESLQIANSMK
ncbi:hypothetical protein [Marinococcus sp. PL1-022]|uniref:hypothetical protein n=1 Tax=Marinococcus sp. PL1-022 TaxID=3095363 RepID=UPI0029C41430|nr:hypothetical protein [Marinococcus sp. PL1-022]MDX6152635.1 hypothetical protein [Marinococcus sp. PL1-022]